LLVKAYLNVTCARKEQVTILVETYSHHPEKY
jgi:hypothetical protein